ETHRGRFTFHSASLLPYLQKYPNLKLTADFSHWCTVSETLLHDQHEILKHVFPRVRHIHARIGFEHSPQVNDPFAPEWKNHVDTFIGWWKEILSGEEQKEMPFMTITPEFGPVPYMPVMPYSQEPLADQWRVNVQIKNMLSMKLKS
nr:sugar phosphate isomerase/epimerase [Cyclobacteriaceae bacterium]